MYVDKYPALARKNIQDLIVVGAVLVDGSVWPGTQRGPLVGMYIRCRPPSSLRCYDSGMRFHDSSLGFLHRHRILRAVKGFTKNRT